MFFLFKDFNQSQELKTIAKKSLCYLGAEEICYKKVAYKTRD